MRNQARTSDTSAMPARRIRRRFRHEHQFNVTSLIEREAQTYSHREPVHVVLISSPANQIWRRQLQPFDSRTWLTISSELEAQTGIQPIDGLPMCD